MTETKLSFLNGWKLESTKNKRDYIYVILCGARSLHWNIVWLCVSLTRPCPLCRQRVQMASVVSSLPPPLLLPARKSCPRNFPSFPVSLPGRQNRVSFVVKATGESSESSTTLTVFKAVQNVWDQPEDRLGLIGLGFAAVAAFWAATNLIAAIDKLPLLPTVLELIGIFYSVWFTYRYLIFKPDREELFQILNKSASDILGQ